MKKIESKDCQTEADLYQYRKQEDEKIHWGVAIFWFFLVMFCIGTLYQAGKAFYLLYKFIF